MEKREFYTVGTATQCKDGIARVAAQERFSVDVSLPRMLHGRILANPYAYTRIKRIDVSKVDTMETIVITSNDIPDVLSNENIITILSTLQIDNYVLADKV